MKSSKVISIFLGGETGNWVCRIEGNQLFSDNQIIAEKKRTLTGQEVVLVRANIKGTIMAVHLREFKWHRGGNSPEIYLADWNDNKWDIKVAQNRIENEVKKWLKHMHRRENLRADLVRFKEKLKDLNNTYEFFKRHRGLRKHG